MFYNSVLVLNEIHILIICIFICIVVKIIFRLFGAEDVDLRTLATPPAIVPPPPPPPQISETPVLEVGKSWAKYKEIKPDTFKTPYKSPTKKMPCELIETIVDNDTMDVDMRAKPTQNNKSHILRQAEEALNAGSISFDEYKKIMCQVRIIIFYTFVYLYISTHINIIFFLSLKR